jgi:3-isopropylmalate dehydrogenase
MPKSSYNICLMRGDGIGPEIFDAALLVLNSVLEKFKISFDYTEVPAGDLALREHGDALPKRSLDTFAQSDACLKGPVGITVMDINTKLRFGFDLYANIRPAKSYRGICPPALRPDIDLIVIRENSEGFYRALENQITPGVWTCAGVFTEHGARRIVEYLMRRRPDANKTLALGTKANIFRNSHGMYLRVFEETAASYPEVRFEHYYADALFAKLVREPQKFRMIVSENLIADLLSDLTGQIAGGLGMTPGTNINYETKHAYFEPTHGSAPDIAGRGIANPIGLVRSASLMLEYLSVAHDDMRLQDASETIEEAVGKLLNSNDKSILPFELGGSANAVKVATALISLITGNDHSQSCEMPPDEEHSTHLE